MLAMMNPASIRARFSASEPIGRRFHGAPAVNSSSRSITGTLGTLPYFTGLNARSTASDDGAITMRLRRSAPRKSDAPVSASVSFAAAPRERI